jgi:hypothetical protein
MQLSFLVRLPVYGNFHSRTVVLQFGSQSQDMQRGFLVRQHCLTLQFCKFSYLAIVIGRESKE